MGMQICRKHASGLVRVHMTRLRSLVRQLFGKALGDDDPAMSPERVTSKWRVDVGDRIGVALTDEQLAMMLEGLRNGLRDAAACFESGTLRSALDDAVLEAGNIELAPGVMIWSKVEFKPAVD